MSKRDGQVKALEAVLIAREKKVRDSRVFFKKRPEFDSNLMVLLCFLIRSFWFLVRLF